MLHILKHILELIEDDPTSTRAQRLKLKLLLVKDGKHYDGYKRYNS